MRKPDGTGKKFGRTKYRGRRCIAKMHNSLANTKQELWRQGSAAGGKTKKAES